MTEEPYDVAAAVNALLGGSTDEHLISGAVMQLQVPWRLSDLGGDSPPTLQVKQLDLTARLEEATVDASTAMPAVRRDLERVRDDAEELRARLTSIEVSLGAVEATTEKSVALLAELDRVKKNLERCAVALREADGFLALSKRLESAQLHDYPRVVEQIRVVRASSQLPMLQAMPEFRDMSTRLAQYERRLEAHLRPKFVAALRASDVKAVLELASVYNDIGQSESLRTAYFDARLEDLQAFWNQYEPPLTSWLPLFYARLQNVVAGESDWCRLLFGRSQKDELAQHLLAHFDGALAARLQSCALPEVVVLHRDAPSKAPYASYVDHYGQLERDFLLGKPTRRASSADVSGGGSGNSVHSASDPALMDPFLAAEQAVDRCQSLTNLEQYAGLLEALEAHFSFRLNNNATKADDAFHRLASAKALQRKLSTFDSKLRARLLAHVTIERFAEDAALPVLPFAEKHVAGLVEAARGEVFESLFGTIRSLLSDYARLPLWSAPPAPVDPDLPRMQPDPTPAVAGVVEHLFALLHHLESLNSVEDQEYWIHTVVKAAVDLFAKQIALIPRPRSASGKEQLQIDVSAVSNLLSALGVANTSLANIKI